MVKSLKYVETLNHLISVAHERTSPTRIKFPHNVKFDNHNVHLYLDIFI